MPFYPTRSIVLAAAILLTIEGAPAQDEIDLTAQVVGARAWTHADGRTIKGGIEGASATKVTLRLPDGELSELELAELSGDDQSYVATWLENNAVPAGYETVDQTVVITTLNGNLKYDKASFSVQPGKKIKLVLRNVDEMHHNLVICKPGKDKGMAVAEEAWKLGAEGFSKHWIPKHNRLLFASKMADPHSTATLYFTAPKRKGKYPYVCTLPGHAMLMNGTMQVTDEVNPLRELTFTLYKGSWNKLPDWEALEPDATDHVASGKIDLACTKERENFGVVFKGMIEAPADGDYGFTLGSDDGSRLMIDRKVVIDHDGIHGMASKSGKTKLTKGLHEIEVHYFEKSGEEALYVGWKPPGAKREIALSSGARPSGGRGGASGQLLVVEDEARVYRNFIQGGGPRAIGVGYPEGVSLAYDANNMRIAMMWQGDFIDAARHWNGRGQGFQPPAGEAVVNGPAGVPFGVLGTADQRWPEEFQRNDNTQQPPVEGGYVFKGYRLDGRARIPSFRYTFAGLAIQDTPVPQGASDSAGAGFARTLTLTGPPVANLYFRAAVAPDIESTATGAFQIGEEVLMTIEASATPVVRDLDGRKELLIPVEFSGGSSTIKQTITLQ